MTLSMAAPAALALAGLVALPLIAHMARQVPRDRTPFGSMLLLQRLVRVIHRRAARLELRSRCGCPPALHAHVGCNRRVRFFAAGFHRGTDFTAAIKTTHTQQIISQHQHRFVLIIHMLSAVIIR